VVGLLPEVVEGLEVVGQVEVEDHPLEEEGQLA